MIWDEAGLSDLQAQLASEMLSHVTAFNFGPDAWLVRGVMPASERRGYGRVALWDGQRLNSSVAFDVPLTDEQGGNVPLDGIVAALRGTVADHSQREAGRAVRDAFGIPVIDASAAVHAFLAQPRFLLTDALHATAGAFSFSSEPEEPTDLRLRGFLLLDEATCRLYLDTPSPEEMQVFGVDLPLRDEKGTVAVGVTGVHFALPALLETGELERMRKNAQDPYCLTVYDMTGWLVGE